MNLIYDNAELLRIIRNIYDLTGIWINIHKISGEDIKIRNAQTDFCREINRLPQGHQRCCQCDADSARVCERINGAHFYRCHAGICEVLLPVHSAGEIIAYLGFGQLLDESPIENQWRAAREKLDWYPGDPEELRALFYRLPQLPKSKMEAMAEMLRMVASYIQANVIVAAAENSDLQRLEDYLRSHYAEKLTLHRICAELGFGTTKLCALAKELSGGHTLTWLIEEYRILDAKRRLVFGNHSIAEIALQVGYDDYNYFTKVFKKRVGMTPSAFRKAQKSDENR